MSPVEALGDRKKGTVEWQARWPIRTRRANLGEWGLARGRLEGVTKQVTM